MVSSWAREESQGRNGRQRDGGKWDERELKMGGSGLETYLNIVFIAPILPEKG